jgi:predicted amidohydrolase YtcJ
MRKSRKYALLYVALLISAAGCAAKDPSRDLIIINAKIWTGNETHPRANALVVKDGRFAYVGEDLVACTYRTASSQFVDAQGARIIPGLIDAHLHLISGGLQLSRLNLRDVRDREEFVRKVAKRATATPKGRWIQGGRWSTESWPDPAQPTMQWIDAVTKNNPVLLSRMDGHGALANSVALKLAGIDKDGPNDPPGGAIERDPVTHEPTGILKDAAIDLVTSHIPTISDLEADAALQSAIKECHRFGISSVHTMSEWREWAVMDRARNRGKLPLRVRFYIMEEDWSAHLDCARASKDDETLRICGVKQYADGSLGSRTAYMAAPYSDNPPDKKDWRGLPRGFIAFGTIDSLCATIGRDLSIAVHAIGDEANSTVLDSFSKYYGNAFGPPEKRTDYIPEMGAVIPLKGGFRPLKTMRLRIEHAQHLLPADIPRFERYGVVASMQPYHKADDGRYAEKAIGPERCKTSYAFKSLLDAGAHVAFGSDWPVVSNNPFLGIHAAITGKTLDGKTFVPEQNITVEQALHAYTTGAAYASGDEALLGKIAIGYAGDLVVLDSDILTATPSMLPKTRVRATYVGGRLVWGSPESPSRAK